MRKAKINKFRNKLRNKVQEVIIDKRSREYRAYLDSAEAYRLQHKRLSK